MSDPADAKAQRSLARLLDIMRRLRDPANGCPWDREQDFASIAPYTIEEAYEVAEAIARGEPRRARSRTRRPAVPGGVSRADGRRAAVVRFRERRRRHRQQTHRAASACVRGCAHRLGSRTESRLGRTQGARTCGARRERCERTRRCAAGAAGAGARRKAWQTRRARGLRLAGCQGVRAKIEEELREIEEAARSRRASRAPRRRTRRPAVRGGELGAAPRGGSRRSAATRQCQVRAAFSRHGSAGRGASAGAQDARRPRPGMSSGTKSKAAEKAALRRRSVGIHRPLRTLAPRSR